MNHGFSVRKHSSKIVNGKMVLCRFVCCHNNKVGSKTGSKKARKVCEFRCGCPTFIQINSIFNSSEWLVGAFNDRHNHAFVTTSNRCYPRMNRIIHPRSQ